ncbi:conjugal transfer protein TrbA [Erwinia sp. STN24]|uniref:secretion/conjugation apparatus DotM-related subunit n=1 Tax=Erwinia sp. STN24 TaxID=3233996 RepID=UPI0035225773
MSNRSNPNHTSDNDSLYFYGGMLVILALFWIISKEWIIYGICRLLFFLYDIIPSPLLPGDTEATKTLLYQAAMHPDRVGIMDFVDVLNMTAIILLPLLLLLCGLFTRIILRSPFYRLTRRITVDTLPWVMVKNSPGIAHVLARFGKFDKLLLNEDPEEAKSARSPVEFSEQHSLIDEDKKRLRKKAAHKVLMAQINLPGEGQQVQLAPHEKALAAAFVYVRFMSDRPSAKSLLDRLNLSCLKTKDGFPDYSLAEQDWQRVSECQPFREFCRGRGSSRTLLHALFDDDLQLPSAQFRWLKGVDRTLWMTLSSVGRGKFFIEGAGVIAWSFCESYIRTLPPEEAESYTPTVRSAVLGLERELARFGRVVRPKPQLATAESEAPEEAPPFPVESDGDDDTPPEQAYDFGFPPPTNKPAGNEPPPAAPNHLEL